MSLIFEHAVIRPSPRRTPPLLRHGCRPGDYGLRRAQKLTWLNQMLEALDSGASYVPLKARVKFIRSIAALPWE